MRADEVPTEITRLTYTAPGPVLSQEQAAELLAHYWPAVREHTLHEAAALLVKKYGVTNRAAGDLRRLAGPDGAGA